MKIRSFRPRVSFLFLSMAVVMGTFCPVRAQQEATSSPEILLKIGRVNETLDLIDRLGGADPNQPTKTLTGQLRAMLQGTHWIDPTRSIVLGLRFAAGEAKTSLLVPFRTENQGFEVAFNAVAGPDYYLLSLPPGTEQEISVGTQEALLAASKSESKDCLSLELALDRLLVAAEGQIKASLAFLDSWSPPGGTQQMDPSPPEVKEALLNMLEMAEQLEDLILGLDLDENRFAASFQVEAAPETTLASLFTKTSTTGLLHSYRPGYQITFRCHPFDIVGVMKLVDASFGKFYRRMGIDFSEIAAMGESFTGETVGGMSFDEDGITMEVMSVLKDTESTPASDFLEEVYMPWMERYSEEMARMVEEQTGTKLGPFYTRTPDSAVAGYKVMGMKTQFPYPQGHPMAAPGNAIPFTEYDVRMTTVGDCLLMAHSDEAMARLIDIAKTVEAGPLQGPLMTMHMDLGGYLRSLSQVMPGSIPPLPDMGKLVFEFDMEEGRANGSFMVMTEDIRTMVAQFRDLAQLAPRGEVVPLPPPAEPETAQEPGPPAPPKEDPVKEWFGKGALCAAYGNDEAAVAYFERVIALDPRNSEAHFQQGVSYGELGRYEEALSLINKALELGQRKGHYLYGRGRVYLLSGDEAKASQDFQEAAALGNRDAREYLESRLHARR
jgi:hypothetical protein